MGIIYSGPTADGVVRGSNRAEKEAPLFTKKVDFTYPSKGSVNAQQKGAWGEDMGHGRGEVEGKGEGGPPMSQVGRLPLTERCKESNRIY